MLISNGRLLVSTQSNLELHKGAATLGIDRRWFSVAHHRYEIPRGLTREELEQAGVEFKAGKDFDLLLSSPEYAKSLKSRVGSTRPPYVWPLRGEYWRYCPSCGYPKSVDIYSGREAEAMRYIQSKGWECVDCQKAISEVDRALDNSKFGKEVTDESGRV